MLFQKNILRKYLALLPAERIDAAWSTFQSYFLNADIQQNILQSKEEQFQEGFLRELFVKVLGYTLNPSPNFNLITEQKNETNSKKADGAILIEEKVVGVIELKDHKTPDLSKVETQAFGYKNQHPDARLVVISNFEKLRLYIDNTVEHIEWNLFTLKEQEFREMYLCLAFEQVKQETALKMKQESVSSEDQITKALYKDYSQFKRALFADIVKNNPDYDQLLLFKKTQKLLDRLLFIFFAEDCALLPPNSMMQIIDQWEKLSELDAYVPFYERIKKYFGYMNTGFQGKKYEIFAYNGGLFKPDEVLDNITISDAVLVEHTKRLSEYDFESEVDVNILGHIFENSLSEIEEMTQQIEAGLGSSPLGEGGRGLVSKRKQDGVFYTPQYITKYIVENTVGRLCTEKKQELGIDEAEYFADAHRQKQTKIRLLDKLTQYREWLKQITILDPACGSGAFLNAALRFLIDEHHKIDVMEAKVTESTFVYPDIDKEILEHNLFGVDINEESVEIAQLALWLRTAQPRRKLNTLNQNIKCGNSLISDPAIAGDKAFDWQKEFPQVFEKGGFDVVIGNPPYVQLQSMGAMSDVYAQCGYETYNKSADLYCLFYEQGCRLLRERGLLGFIASNKWLKANYGEGLRKYIISKTNPFLLVDFPGVRIFPDANVDPQILVLRKESYQMQTQCCLYNSDTIDVSDFVSSHLTTSRFTSEPWRVMPTEHKIIIDRMNSGTPLKKLPISINRGILTGFDDAFYIDEEKRGQLIAKDEKSCELIKPVLFGHSIKAWTVVPQMYLINPHNGIKEKGIPPVDINEYPAIKEHLDHYYDKLERRTDQGVTPYNLRNCSYLECFSAPKLIYPEVTKLRPFMYDESGIMVNKTCFILVAEDESISLKVLASILNSSLADFWIWYNCPEVGDDRRHMGKAYFESFPIPSITEEYALELISFADKMLSLNKDLQEKRSRFLRRLGENLEGVKITSALQNFDELDFAGFLAELKKQKIKLSLSQQDEWEKYFNDNREACQALAQQISDTDKEIDTRVFDLYGLTPEEREIVVRT